MCLLHFQLDSRRLVSLVIPFHSALVCRSSAAFAWINFPFSRAHKSVLDVRGKENSKLDHTMLPCSKMREIHIATMNANGAETKLNFHFTQGRRKREMEWMAEKKSSVSVENCWNSIYVVNWSIQQLVQAQAMSKRATQRRGKSGVSSLEIWRGRETWKISFHQASDGEASLHSFALLCVFFRCSKWIIKNFFISFAALNFRG